MAATSTPNSPPTAPTASQSQSLETKSQPNVTSTSSQPPAREQARSIDIRQSRPIPLTASQEQEVRDLYYKNVRAKCADQIKDFATCCAGRTFSITWACRTQRQAMNTCMNAYAGVAEEDRAREEWFAKLPERQREKDEHEAWREEQKRKKREWWDLDENGRRIHRPKEG